LTSQETYKGLPTTYPVNATTRNGLDNKSYILVHQLTTVEANCFKDADGNWSERIGQLGPEEKQGIEKRLKYFLNIQENPSEDWFKKNASIELLQKVLDFLPDQETKNRGIEALIDRSEE
jgi:mRNA interferase MazF